MAKKKGLTKDQIEELYNSDPGITIDQVAEALGAHPTSIKRAMKRFGITTKPRGARPEVELPQLDSKDWLKHELETKTIRKVATELGTSVGRIADRAYRYGILKPAKGKEARSAAVKAGIQKSYPAGRFGKDSSNWRHGLTPLSVQLRSCSEYKQWQAAILARDYYTCVLCGYKGPDLEADHFPEQFIDVLHTRGIETFEQAMNCADLWNVNNGRTLCEDCHKKTESYGVRPKAKFKEITEMTDQERQIDALQRRNSYLQKRCSQLQQTHTVQRAKIKYLKQLLDIAGADYDD